MVLGIKTLMLSAELYDLDEEEASYEPSKFDLWLEKVFKNKDAVIYILYDNADWNHHHVRGFYVIPEENYIYYFCQ